LASEAVCVTQQGERGTSVRASSKSSRGAASTRLVSSSMATLASSSSQRSTSWPCEFLGRGEIMACLSSLRTLLIWSTVGTPGRCLLNSTGGAYFCSRMPASAARAPSVEPPGPETKPSETVVLVRQRVVSTYISCSAVNSVASFARTADWASPTVRFAATTANWSAPRGTSGFVMWHAKPSGFCSAKTPGIRLPSMEEWMRLNWSS